MMMAVIHLYMIIEVSLKLYIIF